MEPNYSTVSNRPLFRSQGESLFQVALKLNTHLAPLHHGIRNNPIIPYPSTNVDRKWPVFIRLKSCLVGFDRTLITVDSGHPASHARSHPSTYLTTPVCPSEAFQSIVLLHAPVCTSQNLRLQSSDPLTIRRSSNCKHVTASWCPGNVITHAPSNVHSYNVIISDNMLHSKPEPQLHP